MKALSLSLHCEQIRAEAALHVQDACTLGLRKRVKYSVSLDYKQSWNEIERRQDAVAFLLIFSNRNLILNIWLNGCCVFPLFCVVFSK